ncbi:MAG: P-type conjugative transfer protein TrbJ [Alphaproteobacteria bacterium]|nr:P-type conjugative transfer protein TrbJ [Alphaproteobacteria bacterium]MDE2112213.1 P-type conjugative transfer protein TrbJ [Alphaproteobacteria bacterium]MDE2494145.1 P-type conjugative transfer protein TrbJ [Alphaproteobacteria bacterium]
MKRTLAALLVSVVLTSTTAAEAQFFGSSIVFDPSNYAQNLLTATRALEQINNQIQEVQNEALMLQNMGKNLAALPSSQLASMTASLTQVSDLLNQAQGIAFNVNATNAAFARNFPQSYPTGTPSVSLEGGAQQRWQDTMAAFQRTLQVQAQVAENVQTDAATLSGLVNTSQGAVGNLQALQAGNQLQALAIKQQMQIQSLAAVQDRATALDSARNAEAEAAAQSAFSTFIGNGVAYTPQ